MVFVNQTYDMIINTQFYKISFARVLCYPYEGYGSVTPLDATRSKGPFSITKYSLHALIPRDVLVTLVSGNRNEF